MIYRRKRRKASGIRRQECGKKDIQTTNACFRLSDACRLTPDACRLTPDACRLTPVACRLSPSLPVNYVKF